MTTEKLNELLNKACEIITSLAMHADENLANEIDNLFTEINNENEK